MVETNSTSYDPAFLMEAARVFNAAGLDYWGASAALAERAWQDSQKGAVDADIADAIAGDAAALRLAGRLQGGYRGALAVLKTRIGDPIPVPADAPNNQADTRVRLYLLRALALGQQYKDQKRCGKSPGEMVNSRANILSDIRFVFDRRPGSAPLNEPFWMPPRDVPTKDREDDLAEVYADDTEFQKYVDDQVSGSGAEANKAPGGGTEENKAAGSGTEQDKPAGSTEENKTAGGSTERQAP